MALWFGIHCRPALFFVLVQCLCSLSQGATYLLEENGNLMSSTYNASSGSLSSGKTFNVDDFGAKGDGKSDDTQAFNQAWKKACSAEGAVLLVPSSKVYLLKPVTFSGPCESTMTVQIGGKLLASDEPSDYSNSNGYWLLFSNIKNLLVQGSGTIDGNGRIWWQNSCKVNKKLPCKSAPTAVTFYNCNNLTARNFMVQNAQQMHITFQKCTTVNASGLTVSAPGSSPNTDGIHVMSSQNVEIGSTNIGTGDDCISIGSGTQKLRVTNITCGPGHGVSVGSLGAGNSEAYVSDVIVDGAAFSGTTNGVRIKTWQGGSGTASGIKFQNLKMQNVANPIIIDQYYCDQQDACKQQASAVQVKNVTYKGISGTSSTQNAVVFNCSSTVPCQGIVMQDVMLVSNIAAGKAAKSICNNVKLTTIGSVSPSCP